MMWIIPSLLSVIYWLWPACFHLYKGNSTVRFMWFCMRSARLYVLRQTEFFLEGGEPEAGCPGAQHRKTTTLLFAAPWPGAPPAAPDLQMERAEEDRDKRAPATPLAPAAALRPLLAGTSLGSLQHSTHSSSASAQFSFGSNKKWKLKAAQAADKALLKTAWDNARDGVQGRGRSKGNCKPTAISRDWIIKKNNIFSIFFFFFLPLTSLRQ